MDTILQDRAVRFKMGLPDGYASAARQDEMQVRIGEKLVGIGLLDLDESGARFDLWCPDGMTRHDVCELQFFRTMSDTAVAADARVAAF